MAGPRDPDATLRDAVQAAVSRMILSASGWRAVFAADGDEESASPEVDASLLIAAGVAASCFAATCDASRGRRPRIAVGQDTRPTGPALSRAAARLILHAGADIDYLDVCASPEIMAYAALMEGIDGFFYISASHNPIGHNGLKMGGSDGGVLDGAAAATLISAFRREIARGEAVVATARILAEPASPDELRRLGAMPELKARALRCYTDFSHTVIRGPGPRAQAAYDAFRSAVRSTRPGIVGDLNGSARAASIDSDFLKDTGCRVRFINDRPGQIVHQIVPEGEGLSACRAELARLAREGEPYEIGYVPDNDGDRGNLVVYDAAAEVARQLEAQEVFALACVSELSWLVYTGELEYGDDGRPLRRAAVVVNGPTSLRIDRIAARFGAEVHRAEVGEANVVARARELRREGVLVRILGEGSNGGNITHPSAVRDPLHTIHSVLKLCHAPAVDWSDSPARIWLSRCGIEPGDRPSIPLIVSSLPRFTTTSAFEPRAAMRIRSGSHDALKARVESLLPDELPSLLALIPADLQIESYGIVNYEGTVVRTGPGNRTGAGRGGFKILLLDRGGAERGFLWMRGSGTEPVFRVMADIEGDHAALEVELIDRLRDIVGRADAATSGLST